MASINLLPTQFVLKGKDKVLIEGIKKFAFIGFLILTIVALTLGGYLVYLSVRIRSSIGNEETLKSEVTSLQQTEQGLFLIKDRISKIKTVYAKDSADSQITILTGFFQGNPGDYRILEIQVTSQRVNLSLAFPSSSSFGSFYKALVEARLFPNITLKSFSFNPSLGYVAAFELSQK